MQTIAAIATAPGEGGIGIIRISGPDALKLAARVFVNSRGKPVARMRPRHSYLGYIVDEDCRRIDQVLLLYMPSPRSYTGDDVVEISAHGGPVVLKEILSLVLRFGARIAEPGEFTKRAFLNGKIDLAQAEAVIDVISARSRASLRLAERQLAGELSMAVSSLREQVSSLLAHISAVVDFPDDDIPDMDKHELLISIRAIHGALEALLSTAYAGRILREGLSMVIIGRPNVGKSSLLNKLLGRERAIVTDIAGTTRDIIEDYVDIRGIPIKVADTAGIRATDDPVERIGVERAQRAVSESDLLIVVLDQSVPLGPEDEEALEATIRKPHIVALNKADLEPAWVPEGKGILAGSILVPVSALTGLGMEDLAEEISKIVLSGQVDQESVVVANARHEQLLREALSHIKEACESLEQGFTEDVIQVDLYAGWEKLGQVLGKAVNERIVEEIFSRFCIGK